MKPNLLPVLLLFNLLVVSSNQAQSNNRYLQGNNEAGGHTSQTQDSNKDSSGSHKVKGYTTATGTYVDSHRRTNPNATKHDNWSSKPNVNPDTGKLGTKDPYAPRSSERR